MIFKIAFSLSILCFLFATPMTGQELIVSEVSPELIKEFKDCYILKNANLTEFEEAKKIVSDPPCFRQPFIATLKEYLIISFFPNHYRNLLQECFFNQRVIAGALQMYNSEHRIKLRRINDQMLNATFTPLIPEYLKHPFPRAEKECFYKSVGDATDEGGLFIYCTYHGSVQSIDELENR